jgi:muramoyltetrapeptide carboxypeptidase LdcA involved in peptidoglycan recycling
MEPIKPVALKPGDGIGIISPSWGGPAVFPHRLDAGIRQIEGLGYHAITAPHARNQHGYISDTAENRAADIHALFADSNIKAIIAAIGGDHSCHLLPLLDFDLIRRNPKIFMGYSDVTVLNVALYQAVGLITFNGPAVMTDFGEQPAMLPYTLHWMQQVLCRAQPVGKIEPAEAWTEEFQDWEHKEDMKRARNLTPSPGWTWVKPGYAEGRLIGGCLESLQHLRGTRFWPDWSDAIFFFETSEEKPSPETIDGILMDYENMGVFDKLKGMLVGRPMKYNDQEKRALREVLLERTKQYDFPIISDMDFGHTAPQIILPVGCRAKIDTHNRRFSMIEAAVSDENFVLHRKGGSDEYN